jgi:hypothetical protein
VSGRADAVRRSADFPLSYGGIASAFRLTHLILIIFIYSTASWAEDLCLSGGNLSGSYILDKGKGFQPSKLDIRQTSANPPVYLFDLESYWSPRKNDDGSFTTQAIFKGNMKMDGCIATYFSAEDECTLNFAISKNSIRVTHTGACMYIGHNASPDGIYMKKRKIK